MSTYRARLNSRLRRLEHTGIPGFVQEHPDPAKRGKVVDRHVYGPGMSLDVHRRRTDGYTRVEMHFFDSDLRVSLYLNDEERQAMAAAFAVKEPA